MRGWKERRRARLQAGEDRAAIRAMRRAYLAGDGTADTSEAATASDADDWRMLSWPQLRAVARRVRGTPVRNKADAVEAIEAADEAAFREAFHAVTKRIIHGADR
ncbi:MAG: hypothetical protein AAF414_13305 [Pseudomonadota bacterium]